MIETAFAVPRLNEPAPAFSAKTIHGDGTLADYKGKWLILLKHPADFTPVCTTEFIGFAKAADSFKSMNCELLGLSIDPPETADAADSRAGQVQDDRLVLLDQVAVGASADRENPLMRLTYPVSNAKSAPSSVDRLRGQVQWAINARMKTMAGQGAWGPGR